MAKVVLYARFSPRPDEDTSQSCEVQLADLRRWAEKEGHEIMGEYRDDAISGAVEDEIKRPGIWEAIFALRKDWLLACRDVSRLARTAGFQVIVERKVKARGARLFTLRQGLRDDSPMTIFLYRIFSAYAELEREIIRETTRVKMRLHQKAGRCMGSKPPYGWHKVVKDRKALLEPDPKEQSTIARLVDLTEAGMSIRKAAAQLNKEGLRNRRGGLFTSDRCAKILRRFHSGDHPDLSKFDVVPRATTDHMDGVVGDMEEGLVDESRTDPFGLRVPSAAPTPSTAAS